MKTSCEYNVVAVGCNWRIQLDTVMSGEQPQGWFALAVDRKSGEMLIALQLYLNQMAFRPCVRAGHK